MNLCKLDERLKTHVFLRFFVTGVFKCLSMPLRKTRNLVKAGGQRNIMVTQIRKGKNNLKSHDGCQK